MTAIFLNPDDFPDLQAAVGKSRVRWSKKGSTRLLEHAGDDARSHLRDYLHSGLPPFIS